MKTVSFEDVVSVAKFSCNQIIVLQLVEHLLESMGDVIDRDSELPRRVASSLKEWNDLRETMQALRYGKVAIADPIPQTVPEEVEPWHDAVSDEVEPDGETIPADELFDRMKHIVANRLEIDEPESVSMESNFRRDLGSDSLDTYELVYAVEEDFGVSIPDEKANEFETVGDMYDYVKKYLRRDGRLT